ncbi:MAG TPA: acyl-ACP thioesterase domain-containing protein [Anaeromyxobacter sp.]|nr:acyl-ACP thioesterase domain-containing protein [Anaeromyxobacter sp.]
MEKLRCRFTVHTYEVDAFGQLSVPALTGFLAEAAGRHATALGVGIDALMNRGLTWVLVRQRVEVLRAPRLHEELTVETWPSGIDRLAAIRDFRVLADDGTELCRAISQWYVLALSTRRPHPPLSVLDAARFEEEQPHAVRFSAGKLASLERWDREKRFHIRYADIDRNLHVNNGSYLSWAMEAMPREVWEAERLAALEVQYRAECLLGSAVLSRLQPAGGGSYLHGIVREEDGRELARLETRWVTREA